MHSVPQQLTLCHLDRSETGFWACYQAVLRTPPPRV